MFPRYFVARKEVPAPAARGPLLRTVLDHLRLGGRARSAREVVVVQDMSGALHLVSPADLPPALTATLHHHELAHPQGPRLLDVEELWLMSIQMLEQPGDAPGINDPVHLYGRLLGPLPDGVGGSLLSADGQLSLTRSDLLAGLVYGAQDALVLATQPESRCLHAMLPADRPEVLSQGRAVVLAYATLPSELSPQDSCNEPLVANLLYDLLAATKADAVAAGAEHPLKGCVIPVPSRAELERTLLSKGFEVKGDVAVRKSDSSRKLAGMLATLFGAQDADRMTLPPEGTVDDLLQIGKSILPSFPGFPDARITALRSRYRRGPQGAVRPPEPKIPAPSAQAPPLPGAPKGLPPAEPPKPTPKPRKGAPEWMEDFARSEAPETHTRRVTRLDRPGKSPVSSGLPDWMKDFQED